MIWVIIIISIIAIYVFSKFSNDSKSVQKKNISLGGMVKLFPEFVSYFEKNGYELVEDSGTDLVYKKLLTNNQKSNKFLFLGLESKFTNIMYGYIVTQDNKKIKSANVPFSKNYKPEDVEIIIRMITDEFHVSGHLTQLPKLEESDNKVKDPIKLNKLLIELVEEANNNGNSEMDNIDKIYSSLYEREKLSERNKNIDLIAVYTKEIEENPKNKDSYYSRAYKKLLLDDYLGAIEDFKKVIELDPNNSDAIESLADAIESQKDSLEMDVLFQEISDSVIDIDGNIYKTVQIGNQIWMTENLRVSRYRNGDSIPNITNDEEWERIETSAWCNWNNDPESDSKYGKLYNWFTLDEKRNLAPEGWHVASYKEWMELTQLLNCNINKNKLDIDNGLVEVEDINQYLQHPIYESGFSPMQVGCRVINTEIGDNGSFEDMGLYGYWWSSTPENERKAWMVDWYCDNGSLTISSSTKSNGFSVRCVKNIFIEETTSLTSDVTSILNNSFEIIWDKGFCGYRNSKGKMITKFKYEDAENFDESIARVKFDGKYGFINQEGREIIPPIYDGVWNFSDKYIKVLLNNKFGLIDKKGGKIVPLKYDSIKDLNEEVIYVRSPSFCGFLNEHGLETVPISFFTKVGCFNNGLATYEYKYQNHKEEKQNTVCIYINKKGEQAIPFEYEIAFDFIKGYAIVSQDEYGHLYSIIDSQGIVIKSFNYHSVHNLSDGLSLVGRAQDLEFDNGKYFYGNWKYGYIDICGNEVITIKYDYASDFRENLALVGIDTTEYAKYGYIDKEGNEVLPFKYEDANSFSEGLASVRLDDKWGFINKLGIVVINFEYEKAKSFINGKAKVVIKGEELQIDRNGNLVIK